MNAGYNTWQDLRNCKLETIAGLHGMGPTGIAIIKQQLSGLGISFEE
jgi:hypothetical protein